MAFRLGIVGKIWKRPALTGLFLSRWARLHVPGIELVRVCAVSPLEDPTLAEVAMLMDPSASASWEPVETPNRPLCDKGNAAVQALAGRVDAVLNVGSDDFCSTAYIETAVGHIQTGTDYIVPGEMWIYDLATGRCTHITEQHGLKAGSVMSARLLDRLGWQMWTLGSDNPDRGMDHQARRGNAWPALYLTGRGAVLDLKHPSEHISSYDDFTRGRGRVAVDGQDFMNEHFPGLLQELYHAGLLGNPCSV